MHDRTNPSPVLERPPTPRLVSVQAGSRGRHQASPVIQSPAPWTAAQPDPESVLVELSDQFPHATCWFGEYTGSYWALTSDNGTFLLLEGATPDALRRQLLTLDRPARRHQPSSLGSPLQSSVPAPPPQTVAPAKSARRPFRRRSRGRGRHCLAGARDRGGRC
jgi:hypothetical protein